VNAVVPNAVTGQSNAQVPAGVSGPSAALAVAIGGMSAETGVTLAVK
jgi:hypothetical protein